MMNNRVRWRLEYAIRCWVFEQEKDLTPAKTASPDVSLEIINRQEMITKLLKEIDDLKKES